MGFEVITLMLLIGLLFIIIFFVWFFIHRAKTKERLLLIEKGISLDNIPKVKKLKFPWLKTGIVILCGTLGVLIGGFIEYYNFFKPEESTPLFEKSILSSSGMISLLFMYLFGAIGMILAHFIDKPKKK